MELNKITLAEIIYNNGGSMSFIDLKQKLIQSGATDISAENAINEFVKARLVKFENNIISFVD